MAEFDPNHQPPPSEAPPTPPKKYVKRTAFFITATVIALVLLMAAVMDPLVNAINYIFSLLSPLLIGAVIAYLCNPILKLYEYRVFRRMERGNMRRGLSLLMTVVTAIGILALICAMMIPQLIASINELMANYDVYINSFLGWFQNILDSATENMPVNVVDISDIEKLTEYLNTIFGSVEENYTSIFANLENILAGGNVVEKVWELLQTFFTSLVNIILGIFIAFYILASKEKRAAQIRKFRRAMFNEKVDGTIQEVVTLANKTFGGFFYGKILDSLVIGILTFILLTIFEISPYNLLIATFVGITNIIPVFGPFIGAIPSAFIMLISNPSKFFLFIILVLIIQQIDGNLLCPKIQGDNTGISSLAVLVSITIASGQWGVIGMVIGVPICAVIIELVKRLLEYRLESIGEPTDTVAYYPEDALGNAEKDVHYEHSGLLYQYEHSALKPKVEKIKARLYKLMGYKGKTEDPSGDPSQEAETQGPDGDSAPLADDTAQRTADVTLADVAEDVDGHEEEACASSTRTTSSGEDS